MVLDHRSGSFVPAGHQAILSAAIMGAWTAFGILAEGLWAACVKARPETLLKSLTEPEQGHSKVEAMW